MSFNLRFLSPLIIVSIIAIYGCSAGGLTARVAGFLDEGRNALRTDNFGRAQEQFQKGLAEAQRSGDSEGTGYALSALGDVHRARKEHEKAIEKYQDALPFFTRGRKRFMEALTLDNLAGEKQELGKDQEAVALLDNAISIWNDLLRAATPRDTDKTGLSLRAGAFAARARSHRILRKFDDALRDYHAAATDYLVVSAQDMAGSNLFNAAELLIDELGRSESAIDLFMQAIPLLDNASEFNVANLARLRLGSIYLDVLKSGYAEKAAKTFGETLAIAETQGLPDDVSHAHFGLARAFERLAEFDKALIHYQAMLKQDRLQGGGDFTNSNYLGFYGAKAKIYRHLGRYEEAIETFSAVLLKLKEIKDEKGEAGVSTMLAEVYVSIDDPHTAIRYYRRALELYKTHGDTFSQINVLSALCKLYVSNAISTEEARGYLETGRELLQSVKGLDLLTLIQGVSPGEARDIITLKKFLDSASDKIRGKNRGEINDFASEQLASLGRWPVMVAGNWYQMLGRLALVDRDASEYADVFLTLASAYHNVFRDRETTDELFQDLYLLGEDYREREMFDAALDNFRFIEKWAVTFRTPTIISSAYLGLAATYADLNDYENAIGYYKKGLSAVESIEGQQVTDSVKIGTFAGASSPYNDMIPILLKAYAKTNDEHHLREAFQYTERLKSRSFREMFFKSRTARLGGDVSEFTAKEEMLRLEIQMINDRLQSGDTDSSLGINLLDRLHELRNSLLSLRQEIAKLDRAFGQIVSTEPVSIKQVQDNLTPNDVVLEFSNSSLGITLWIITKEEVRYKLMESDNTFSELLVNYLQSLRQPLFGSQDISTHITLGGKLYQKLFGQVEKFLGPKTHLIIVPDGQLYYLPFEALIETSSQNDTKKYSTLADVPYLIKKFQISYVPSASILVAQNNERVRQPPGQLPLLAFGDPVYRDNQLAQMPENDLGKITNVALRGFDLKRLEFSGEEVRRIARIWEVSPTSDHVNLGERATVERVRALNLSRYRIIHFATHAVAGDQVGRASQPALVLSQQGTKNQSEGLLQFSDILDLKLNADLVVLSACETGLGKLRYGEGIVGLTRAFLYAGASSAVVSLWKVEDQSTSLLMEKFYQWLKKGANKAEALRQAKLEILNSKIELKAIGNVQSLASPFFWAPFILVGDPAPLRN